jgi:8-oxo-dGTP pyrophosphatase MutT (NUDIX family)
MANRKKPNGAGSTHAGGVVYRLKDASHELLLVTSKYDKSIWVLPKGHIEPGESSDETAIRETFEEAGVTARVIEFLTTSRQVVHGSKQQIEYYLLEALAEEKSTEGRKIAWLAGEAAIRRLTFDEQRAVLTKGYARLEQSRGIQ